MTTEREYREWQDKRRKYRRTPKTKLRIPWLFLLVLVSALLFVKNPKQIVDLLSNYQPIQLDLNIEDNNPLNLLNNREITAGSIKEIKNNKYAKIDKLASSINYDGDSVYELASLLSKSASTEAEKARIIYAWIAYNITYDVPAYLSGDYGDASPGNILKTRKGVCSGYANLYKAVAKAMGLDIVVIEGYAKGNSYLVGEDSEVNHAWNAVKINNGWYIVDPTWGAGSVNDKQFKRNFNPYYFATPPNQFIYDHFPSKVKWQLLTKPYTKQQFDAMPEVSSQFFLNKLQLVSHKSNTIQANGKLEISLKAPTDVIVLSKLKQDSNLVEDTYTFVQRKEGKIIVSAAFPSPGTYQLEIYSKKRNQPGAYNHAVTYNISAHSSNVEFPLTYSTFSENSAHLYSPLKRYLIPNESVYVKINAPNALEVQVIDKSSNKWTKLTRSGSLFEGNVFVGSGKMSVSAKFRGDEKYWTLVEYN